MKKEDCKTLKPLIVRESSYEASDEWCKLEVEIVLGYGYGGTSSFADDRRRFRKELHDFVANWKPSEVEK